MTTELSSTAELKESSRDAINANNHIKTYIYKTTKSKFAFAINFHSLKVKKNLIVKNKLKLINDQPFKQKHTKLVQFEQLKQSETEFSNETPSLILYRL